MDCQNFKTNFSAYIDRELDEKTLAGCESHLRQCASCSRLVAAYRSGISVLSEITELEAPEDLFERVMAAVEQPQEAKVIRWGRPRVWVPVTAAATLVFALTLSLFRSGEIDSGAYSELAVVDSTMDLVTVQMLEEMPQYTQKPSKKARARAYLASYIPDETGDEEAVLSYGVSRHPVFIESGVGSPGE
jgi:predicted anti-sigma-YlaC factor YlaD